ncbi:MAG: hypothetical protein M1834_002185 [Cirrosporium novae-zelandiae]|nr:MAG: hypothetical protein M1834_002185 [Cirrosporium novae-zelandiae]
MRRDFPHGSLKRSGDMQLTGKVSKNNLVKKYFVVSKDNYGHERRFADMQVGFQDIIVCIDDETRGGDKKRKKSVEQDCKVEVNNHPAKNGSRERTQRED